MQSILLDNVTWDLVLNANRNLAICSPPYAVLQDVATSVRVWSGELPYDATFGIPYDTTIFSDSKNTGYLEDEVERVTRGVSGVASAQCALDHSSASRKLTGTIRVELKDGTTAHVSL